MFNVFINTFFLLFFFNSTHSIWVDEISVPTRFQDLRAHSKISPHFDRLHPIWPRFRALPGGRLNAQNCELIFS
jgi:hypothetical protein